MKMLIASWIKLIYSVFPLLFFVEMPYASQLVIGSKSADIGSIIIISPKRTDTPSSLGAGLLNTIAGITDASAENQYLIKLGPGTYDVGASGLTMKQWVSIEGSGEKATFITGSTTGNASPTTGALVGANNTEVRSLSVKNTTTSGNSVAVLNKEASPAYFHVTAVASGGTYSYGMANYSCSPSLIHVTAYCTGGDYAHGVFNYFAPAVMIDVAAAAFGNISSTAVTNSSSNAVMRNVTAEASDATSNVGLHNYLSTPKIDNLNIAASGGDFSCGIYAHSSSFVLNFVKIAATGSPVSLGIQTITNGTIGVNNSVIEGATNTIYNGTGVTTKVGNSQLIGGPVTSIGTGTVTCAGVYDENYIFSESSCP